MPQPAPFRDPAASPTFNTPQAVRGRDARRLADYDDNQRFYDGEQWRDSGRNLLIRNPRARRLTLNLTRTFVTKSASYVNSGVEFVVDPLDDTAEQVRIAATAELAIHQVHEQNGIDARDFDNELSCSVLGDAAYKVTWDDTEHRVRIAAPDPASLHAWRSPDDPDDLLRVAQLWSVDAATAASFGVAAGDHRTRPQLIEDWTADTYTLWLGTERVRTQPNPYGFIPYVIYPNIREPRREWGVSDVAGLRDAATDLNRLMTQMSLIAELSGNPIAVLENIGEGSDLNVQPGAIWEIPEKAKAYLLELLGAGGANALNEWALLLRQFLHDLAETPRTAFGDNDAAVSGVALKLSLDPLAKKVARKRLIRSRALSRRSDMVLALLRQYAGLDELVAAADVRIVWGDIDPSDRTRDIQDEALLVNAGIHSRRRAASNLGDEDPDTEFQRYLQENRELASAPPPASQTHPPGPTPDQPR